MDTVELMKDSQYQKAPLPKEFCFADEKIASEVTLHSVGDLWGVFLRVYINFQKTL
jgi:hypothetical protein